MNEHDLNQSWFPEGSSYGENRFVWQDASPSSTPTPDDSSLEPVARPDDFDTEATQVDSPNDSTEDDERVESDETKDDKVVEEESGFGRVINLLENPEEARGEEESLRKFVEDALRDDMAISNAELAGIRSRTEEAIAKLRDGEEVARLMSNFPDKGHEALKFLNDAGIINMEEIIDKMKGERAVYEIVDHKGWGPIAEALSSDADIEKNISLFSRMSQELANKNPNMEWLSSLDAHVREASGMSEAELNILTPRNEQEMEEFANYMINSLKGKQKNLLEGKTRGEFAKLDLDEIREELGVRRQRMLNARKKMHDIGSTRKKMSKADLHAAKQAIGGERNQAVQEYLALSLIHREKDGGRKYGQYLRDEGIEVRDSSGRTSEDVQKIGEEMDRKYKAEKAKEAMHAARWSKISADDIDGGVTAKHRLQRERFRQEHKDAGIFNVKESEISYNTAMDHKEKREAHEEQERATKELEEKNERRSAEAAKAKRIYEETPVNHRGEAYLTVSGENGSYVARIQQGKTFEIRQHLNVWRNNDGKVEQIGSVEVTKLGEIDEDGTIRYAAAVKPIDDVQLQPGDQIGTEYPDGTPPPTASPSDKTT